MKNLLNDDLNNNSFWFISTHSLDLIRKDNISQCLNVINYKNITTQVCNFIDLKKSNPYLLKIFGRNFIDENEDEKFLILEGESDCIFYEKVFEDYASNLIIFPSQGTTHIRTFIENLTKNKIIKNKSNIFILLDGDKAGEDIKMKLDNKLISKNNIFTLKDILPEDKILVLEDFYKKENKNRKKEKIKVVENIIRDLEKNTKFEIVKKFKEIMLQKLNISK